MESQWQDTTAELKSIAKELDSFQRERLQRVESRQSVVEARVSDDAAVSALAARLEIIEAELAMAKANSPPWVVSEDDNWVRLPHIAAGGSGGD